MTYSLYGFTGQAESDPNAQVGLQQYLSQGAAQINPGQAQVMASNPMAYAARSGIGQAFANQSPQLPAQQPPSSYTPSLGNPNMGYDSQSAGPGFFPSVMNQMSLSQPGFDQYAQQQGQSGPTPQQLLLAQGLMSAGGS